MNIPKEEVAYWKQNKELAISIYKNIVSVFKSMKSDKYVVPGTGRIIWGINRYWSAYKDWTVDVNITSSFPVSSLKLLLLDHPILAVPEKSMAFTVSYFHNAPEPGVYDMEFIKFLSYDLGFDNKIMNKHPKVKQALSYPITCDADLKRVVDTIRSDKEFMALYDEISRKKTEAKLFRITDPRLLVAPGMLGLIHIRKGLSAPILEVVSDNKRGYTVNLLLGSKTVEKGDVEALMNNLVKKVFLVDAGSGRGDMTV